MEFDVLDPNLYAGDPFPTYAELRRNAPIYWDAKNRCWVLSKYEDVEHSDFHLLGTVRWSEVSVRARPKEPRLTIIP